MPRPRFDKVSAGKRERILEAAARAFAADGFEGASLNKILEAAGISKGAAYYYFDDKGDLFLTTVAHYAGQLLAELRLAPEALTADTYWPALADLYRHQLSAARARPWAFGVVKAAATLPDGLRQAGPLADMSLRLQQLLLALLQRGQQLGVVRTDLPFALLLGLVGGVDEAFDTWLLAAWAAAGATADPPVETAVATVVDLLQRLLQPQAAAAPLRQAHD